MQPVRPLQMPRPQIRRLILKRRIRPHQPQRQHRLHHQHHHQRPPSPRPHPPPAHPPAPHPRTRHRRRRHISNSRPRYQPAPRNTRTPGTPARPAPPSATPPAPTPASATPSPATPADGNAEMTSQPVVVPCSIRRTCLRSGTRQERPGTPLAAHTKYRQHHIPRRYPPDRNTAYEKLLLRSTQNRAFPEFTGYQRPLQTARCRPRYRRYQARSRRLLTDSASRGGDRPCL